MLSLLSHIWLFATPWTVFRQSPLSMGFSRQEYQSGFPCPPLGDLPDPGIEPMLLLSPASAEGFFTTSANWESRLACVSINGQTNHPGIYISSESAGLGRDLRVHICNQHAGEAAAAGP